MNADEIKNYIVKIDYNKPNKGLQLGSGVVVTLDGENSYFYIFSAKHTFFNKEFELNEKRDTQIKLSNPNNRFTKELYNVEVVWCKKDYDFIVFKIVNDFDFKLAPLSISNNEEFSNCIIYGYPEMTTANNSPHFPIECKYNQINNNDSFYVLPNIQLASAKEAQFNNHKNIVGLSGAGVFVSNSHLIGIQIQSGNGNVLLCFDLRIVIDELNEDLINLSLKSVKTEGFSLVGNSYDISDLDLNDYTIKPNNNYISQIKDSNDEINFLLDTSSSYYKTLNNEQNALKKSMQRMAETYLYHAITFHQNGENLRATINFKKAIFLSQNITTHFAKALLERKSQNLSKEDKDKLKQISNIPDDENKADVEWRDKSYKKYDLLQEIEKNKDNPLKLIELKKLYIDLLDKEEDKEEILNLRFEIAKLFINDKNEILKEIEILFNSIAPNSNKRDDFVKKIDEIQKDKDTIIDLNAHLNTIKEEFIESLKNTVNQETLTESLKETFNQETLTESLKETFTTDKLTESLKETLDQNKLTESLKQTLTADKLTESLQETLTTDKFTKSLRETFDQEQLKKSLQNINEIKGTSDKINKSSNEILKGINSNHNQQTILTIGLLFVLSILVFVLVFILIFFTD